MFQRFRAVMSRFLYGRYGTDQLNVTLLVTAISLSLLGSLLSIPFRYFWTYSFVIYPILHLLTLALLGAAVFRMLSRNIYARQRENRRFQFLWLAVTDRRNRYYRCPRCGQSVRVPRGRGKINISCPKCGEKFQKKT